MDMNPEEIFDWDVEMLDAGLKQLVVRIGNTQSKTKKANELNKGVEQMNSGIKIKTPVQSQDSGNVLAQALQLMQAQFVKMEAKSNHQRVSLRTYGEFFTH